MWYAHSLTPAAVVVLQICRKKIRLSSSAVSAGGRYTCTLTHTPHMHLSWYPPAQLQNTKTILAANSQGHVKVKLYCTSFWMCMTVSLYYRCKVVN